MMEWIILGMFVVGIVIVRITRATSKSGIEG